jgi:hypothetical protein
VKIYEGMKDLEFEHAMTHHFNRIQGMMFVNTVVTDDDGGPLKDAKGRPGRNRACRLRLMPGEWDSSDPDT